ncbi:MAG: ribosomal-processing cysteine protease Prp [Oscillospiraceae bacterium]|nr:ribosomal-processing cysteine protease Prp [Oscillospiraceae bacterium]
MVTARFYNSSDNKMLGFHVSGHAGFSDFGNDIACASVSSAVMLTANTITEVFKINAKVEVNENEILLKLLEDKDGSGDKLLLGLLMQMDLLSDEFPGAIKIVTKQV